MYAIWHFERNPDWTFEIFFGDESSEHTYKDTRIAEMYIKADDVTQWMWSGLDSDDKQLDWDYRKLVFDGLMEGIAFTNTQRPLSDPSAQPHTYCMWRLKRIASDLTKIGIAPALAVETLWQAADQGENFITLTFQTRSSDDGNSPPSRVPESSCKLIAFRAIVNGGG